MNPKALAAALAAIALGGAVLPLSRSETSIAGLSTDFWAGFLLGAAIALLSLAVFLASSGDDRQRSNGRDAGMTGGRKRV